MDNKYKILQKSWKIDLSRIDEGFLYSKMSTLADTRSKAKSLLLDEYASDIQIEGRDAIYINIPVIRDYEGDLFDYNGTPTTMTRIRELEEREAHHLALDSILKNKEVSHCYIVKRGQYYMGNYCGYTSKKSEAGVYKKEDAVSHARYCEELSLQPIDIDSHNQMINNAIEQLRKRLII